MEKLSRDSLNLNNLQKRKEKILREEYPPSFKSLLDNLTKEIYKRKEKEKSSKEFFNFLRDTKRLLQSLDDYWRAYRALEEAAKEAREERRLKGASLEPQDIQSINQNLRLHDLSRRNAHLDLIKNYYTFIDSYEKFSGHEFPWLSSNICDKGGAIKSEFLEYSDSGNSRINADKILPFEGENIKEWAIKIMEEKDNDETRPEKQQELKPYLDLIDYEWDKQVKRRKSLKEKLS